MLGELGYIALLIALLLSLFLSLLPLIGAQRDNHALMQTARPSALAMTGFILLAYLILTEAFISQDFSLKYVQQNSNTLLPMIYRISAVWGAHEGSLLLWVLILCGWVTVFALMSKQLPLKVSARVLGVMGVVCFGFIAFTAFTSNPFERILPAAMEGRDLNPLLQDPGLIFHPPLLYMGYVGFIVAFAFAVAALLDGKVDAQWIRWARPWTNAAWAFLTLGIALGSWWAYYELGWGGWWFWDPVENASFMPWLLGAALIHSQATTEKRGSFRAWTLLLAITTFALSLLGTFLVRSGVLTSVHAFASDPARGLFILAFLGLIVGGALWLYAVRAPDEERGSPFQFYSRETLLLANNLLLSVATIMILFGTLFPLLMEALDQGKVSVGSPYFGTLFSLLMIPLVMLVPFGPLTRWQSDQVSKIARLLLPWAALAIVCALIALWHYQPRFWMSAVGVSAAVWLIFGTARFIWQRTRVQKQSMTAEMWGMSLAHFGLGIFFASVLLSNSLSIEKDVAASPRQRFELRGYTFIFNGVKEVRGPNYLADQGEVAVEKNGKVFEYLRPEKRRYASGGAVMTEAAIDGRMTRDLYVALGDQLNDKGSWALRLHVKPFVRGIWLAALMMAMGALIVIFDRRFRNKNERAA